MLMYAKSGTSITLPDPVTVSVRSGADADWGEVLVASAGWTGNILQAESPIEATNSKAIKVKMCFLFIFSPVWLSI